jgi:hypothetical protein
MRTLQVAACCDVVYMPGETDPSSLFLPQVRFFPTARRLLRPRSDHHDWQAPLHHCFVSTASTFSSAIAVSNPCELTLGAFSVIATGVSIAIGAYLHEPPFDVTQFIQLVRASLTYCGIAAAEALAMQCRLSWSGGTSRPLLRTQWRVIPLLILTHFCFKISPLICTSRAINLLSSRGTLGE